MSAYFNFVAPLKVAPVSNLMHYIPAIKLLFCFNWIHENTTYDNSIELFHDLLAYLV